MGWGIVPNIKDERVVCQQPCEHRDCAASRKQWGEGRCGICGKPFLAGEKFYYRDDGGAEHAICNWEKLEKGE